MNSKLTFTQVVSLFFLKVFALTQCGYNISGLGYQNKDNAFAYIQQTPVKIYETKKPEMIHNYRALDMAYDNKLPEMIYEFDNPLYNYNYDREYDYQNLLSKCTYVNLNDSMGKHHHHRRLKAVLKVPRGTLKNVSKTAFLINQTTDDNGYNQNYSPKFSKSKLYVIKTRKNVDLSLLMVSNEEDYFPQMEVNIASPNARYFSKLAPYKENFATNSNVYRLKGSDIILIEIGHDKSLDSHFFNNKKEKGDFSLIISFDPLAITDYLNDTKIRTSKYKGKTEFENGKTLALSSGSTKNLSHGKLSLKLTPFYNEKKESISLFYINGSGAYNVKKGRSSVIEEFCSPDRQSDVLVGSEPVIGHYKFYGPGKNVCDFVDLLKELK